LLGRCFVGRYLAKRYAICRGRAITVNIQIIRIFIRIRQMLAGSRKLRLKIEEMERRYDNNFKIIFDTLKKMIVEEEKPKKIMGFVARK
jgi:hypothetical protein